MTENQDQNNAAFVYSASLLKMLLKMELLTQEEYERILRISAAYYHAENIYV